MSDNWLNTHSNKVFEPGNPTPEMVDLDSIAWALSRIPRFGGQSKKWWSVADHCVTMTVAAYRMGAPANLRRALLLHDAAEAYAGDMVRSLKNIVPGFKAVEERIFAVIAAKYQVDLSPEIQQTVKWFDLAMIRYECAELFPGRPKSWNWEKTVDYPELPEVALVGKLVNYYADREPRDGYNRFLRMCRQDAVLSVALEKGD